MNKGNKATNPITGKQYFDGAHGTKRTVREPWTPGKNKGSNFGANFGGTRKGDKVLTKRESTMLKAGFRKKG